MDGIGYLKTVSFGGFDKKDVLTYVDKLNTQIYTLENELNEKKALLETSGSGDKEIREKYEQLLEADKAKLTELQTNNESLKMQLKSCEDESAAKDKEIEDLKKHISDLENELVDAKNKAAAASSVDNSAMDLTNVFVEAQRTASTIVTQAKENARKMDEDAKKLANQVVDDANSKASTIVKSADEKASKVLAEAEDKSTKMVSDAEGKAAEMRTAANNMKAVVLEEISEIDEQVKSIKSMLEQISKQNITDSISRISETATLLANTQDTLKKDGIPTFTPPKSAAPAPAPAPAAPKSAPRAAIPAPAPAPARAAVPTPAPAPAPARAATPAPAAKPAATPTPAPAPAPAAHAAATQAKPKPAPKLGGNFGFDLSEIEKMAKAIEADASKGGKDYDGNVDAKGIKLSDMG